MPLTTQTYTPTKEKRALIQSQIDTTPTYAWFNVELPHQKDYKTLRAKLKPTSLRAVYCNGFPVVYSDNGLADKCFKVFVKIAKNREKDIRLIKLDSGLVYYIKYMESD